MKASNTVREELLKSLDSFRDSFEVIGTYFSIYHGFPEVSKAAISLGVAILKAIEEVIGYYLQHAGRVTKFPILVSPQSLRMSD